MTSYFKMEPQERNASFVLFLKKKNIHTHNVP